jgi:AcrR family transcriptional regulator
MASLYELKKRAERMAETRRRIVEAAVHLHTTRGPAATSLSAVAAQAGVQRHTLYAHFPDLDSLFDACSAHWQAEHPQPDLGAALALADPAERLRAVLLALYGWYESVEGDVALFERDAHLFPAVTARTAARRRQLRDTLAEGCDERARAAIGHALAFETWRSLVRREGLTPHAAAELMAELAFASPAALRSSRS